MVLLYFNIRDENPLGIWTLNLKDSQSNSNTGKWNHWSITFWGGSSRPNVILNPHNRPAVNIIKNSTSNSSTLPVQPGIIIETSYFSIIFGFFCLVMVVFGIGSATTLWKRITRNKNRSNIADADRYIPIEDELDDAFLEAQLREVLDEEL